MQFVETLSDESARMSTAQVLSLRTSWCIAADELADADYAVPILSEDEPGLWVMCWAYPAERLVLEVNSNGWVEWTHTSLTGHRKPVWGVHSSGSGIPEGRIRTFVHRRAKALGVDRGRRC